MLWASVDIGTNSVLLLVAEISGGKIETLREEQELPRLGLGVDRSGKLHPESISRVLDSLKRYQKILSDTEPELPLRTVVSATSAVRDAANREEFLSRIEAETGWKVKVLSGDDEARVTYRGAMRVLADAADQYFLVIDIGGGSTEMARGRGMEYLSGISLDMGSVRFTERFLRVSPPDQSALHAARDAVWERIPESVPAGYEMVGVAGTVTTIAAVIAGMVSYNAGKLNGYELRIDDLQKFIRNIADLNSSEIEMINPFFLRGRSDVILAGALILEGIMKKTGKESLIVSTGGIRHGLL